MSHVWANSSEEQELCQRGRSHEELYISFLRENSLHLIQGVNKRSIITSEFLISITNKIK
jgi:hypothetical protein